MDPQVPYHLPIQAPYAYFVYKGCNRVCYTYKTSFGTTMSLVKYRLHPGLLLWNWNHWPGPEKVIWFLPARKSTFLAYSQQQEKLRKFLQKYGLGSSFPLDIIIISANHIINASSLTPVHLPYSRNLPILLQFCVFWGPSSQRRGYAAMLSQALPK